MRSNMLLTIAVAAVSASAQDIVSAKAGLIHEIEGEVQINGETVKKTGDVFLSMKEGETFSTERGRAEILLNPGTYLRIGEASSFKLDSADLDDTRLTLLTGTVIIEVSELPKDTSATLSLLGSQVALKKRGLYEFTADKPGNVRVYDGELALTAEAATPIKIGKGREIAFNALSAGPGKFDQKQTSELYNWGSRRAIYIAQANESAARSAYSSGGSRTSLTTLYGSPGLYSGVWAFNTFYGIYTFLPYRGFGYSPFGYRIYSPQALYAQTYAPVSSGFNASSQTMQRSAVSSGAYSGAAVSSSGGGAMAAPAASAPAVSTPNTGGGGDAGRRR